MERTAPRELNKALKQAMEPVELVASSRTPRGTSGVLQRSNRVVAKGNRVVLQNRAPYANTIHWGRSTWPSVRSGAPPSGRTKHASVVKARPWLYDTLKEQEREIGRRVIRSIELFLEHNVR